MSMMTCRHRREREARFLASLKNPVAKKKGEKPVEAVKVEEPKEEKKPEYNKSEINRMPVDELKKVVSEIGIEDSADKTGGELKKLIIEKLGL